MKAIPRLRTSQALVLPLLVAVPQGCKKKATSETPQQQATVPSAPTAQAAASGSASAALDTSVSAPSWFAHAAVRFGGGILIGPNEA